VTDPCRLYSTRTSPASAIQINLDDLERLFWLRTRLAAACLHSQLHFRTSGRCTSVVRSAVAHAGWSFPAHAGIFAWCKGPACLLLAGRARPTAVVGAGAQIDIRGVHVAGDVRIIAERRHHVALRRNSRSCGRWDHADEVAVTHGLDRIGECRGKVDPSRRGHGRRAFRVIAAVPE